MKDSAETNHPSDIDDALDDRRRVLSVLFGGLGVAALAGCIEEGTSSGADAGSFGTFEQAVSGTSFVWFDNIAAMRAGGTSHSLYQIAVVAGYHAANDGGGGIFVWNTWDGTSANGDNSGTIIVPTGATDRRWRRLYEGRINVRWFGAKGDNLADDSTAIQAAINVLGVNGGTVFFPKGEYLIGSTIALGGDGTSGQRDDGVILCGESRSRNPCAPATETVIRWVFGANTTGPLLKIRNANTGEIRDLTFDANNRLDTGVQFNHVSSLDGAGIPNDFCIVSSWTVVGCTFGNARVQNVLIGTPSGDSGGDCSNITFDTCYFAPAIDLGSQTNSHVRQRAWNTFSTTFINCRFGGDQTYPTHAISLQAGTANVFGGTFEVMGGATFYMDARSGIVPPSICIYGVESQSTRFLETSTSAGAAAQRATVISGCSHTDIVSPTEATSIIWDVAGYAPLILDGVRMEGDINISNSSAKVFANGVLFDNGPGGGSFTGYTDRVYGTWFGGGDQLFHGHLPGVGARSIATPVSAAILPAGTAYSDPDAKSILLQSSTNWVVFPIVLTGATSLGCRITGVRVKVRKTTGGSNPITMELRKTDVTTGVTSTVGNSQSWQGNPGYVAVFANGLAVDCDANSSITVRVRGGGASGDEVLGCTVEFNDH